MFRFKKGVLLIVGSCLLNGCDSNYHLFDGLSGYKFATINPSRFTIQYYGNEESSLNDVTTMWHHKARELCKGAAYKHAFLTPTKRKNINTSNLNSNFLPKDDNYYLLEGEVNCLAPNYAEQTASKENSLLSKHLTTDQFISGRATN
ncbi:hypothetical protein [Neptuniibacter sp. 2_MG-2023]|uniref:hypothetical protein n=1 Tax=Neptuniibacter sp. 2_MG-2023 TaxID=3062671 RepID=UPI0026E3B126|nr:hypothetical protein [Neptuniibacter sp. 2_MG-2023]MDO6513024.1 hypothetical protein [Neptuniibacter sp. 2_MG-2023]